MGKRLLAAALEAAARALASYVRRRAISRAVASLDGCDFCGAPADAFLDVTPRRKVITSRLACWPCGQEAVKAGARVLMGVDGRPVTHGRH